MEEIHEQIKQARAEAVGEVIKRTRIKKMRFNKKGDYLYPEYQQGITSGWNWAVKEIEKNLTSYLKQSK